MAVKRWDIPSMCIHMIWIKTPKLTGQDPQGILIRPVVSTKGLIALYSWTFPESPDPPADATMERSHFPSYIKVLRIVSISSLVNFTCNKTQMKA
jgi:hypothetical protein